MVSTYFNQSFMCHVNHSVFIQVRQFWHITTGQTSLDVGKRIAEQLFAVRALFNKRIPHDTCHSKRPCDIDVVSFKRNKIVQHCLMHHTTAALPVVTWMLYYRDKTVFGILRCPLLHYAGMI